MLKHLNVKPEKVSIRKLAGMIHHHFQAMTLKIVYLYTPDVKKVDKWL